VSERSCLERDTSCEREAAAGRSRSGRAARTGPHRAKAPRWPAGLGPACGRSPVTQLPNPRPVSTPALRAARFETERGFWRRDFQRYASKTVRMKSQPGCSTCVSGPTAQRVVCSRSVSIPEFVSSVRHWAAFELLQTTPLGSATVSRRAKVRTQRRPPRRPASRDRSIGRAGSDGPGSA
jgi:hypothetical protein